MVFIRHTKVASECEADKRVSAFADEMAREPQPGGISLYRVEDESELETVAALYSAKRKDPRGFGYFRISDELLAALKVVPVAVPEGSPFRWMNDRHYEFEMPAPEVLRKLAEEVARNDAGGQFPKKTIRLLVEAEKTKRPHTFEAEWDDAGDWTKEIR